MDNTKISRKQILLLSVLIGVLAIVVSFTYVIKPVFSEIKQLKEETAEMENSYSQMMDQSSFFAVNQVNFKKNQDLLKEKTDKLIHIQKTNELDTLITNMALSSGLTVGNLKIGDIEEYSITMKYSSEEDEKKSDDEKKEDKSKDGEESKKSVPDKSMYPGAEISYNSKNEKYSLIYHTGEYSCTMKYGLKGTYSQIQNFVAKLADNPSIGINTIKVSNENEILEDSVFSMDISIAVNMVGDIPDLSYQGDGADAETE